MVQEARAGTNPGSGPANPGFDVPGRRTRGGSFGTIYYLTRAFGDHLFSDQGVSDPHIL